jgi:hypothetical protein
MLNRLSIFLIILLVLSSCNKEKSAAKKINGEWEITNYKRTETNGLSFFASVSGEMLFSHVDHYDAPLTFKTSITYSFDTDNGVYNENGIIEMIEKGEYMNVIKLNTSNIPIDTIKYRIITNTTKDLQLEFIDSNNRIHMMIFKKKK